MGRSVEGDGDSGAGTAIIQAASANEPVLRAKVQGDAFPRVELTVAGSLKTGDGTAAPVASGTSAAGVVFAAAPSGDITGVTDTAAIIAAYALAGASGVVRLYQGTYWVNSPILRDAVIGGGIEGAGKGATIIKLAANFDWTGVTSNYGVVGFKGNSTRWRLANLTVDGNTQSTNSHNSKALASITTCDQGTMAGVEIKNAGGSAVGLNLIGATHSRFFDVYVGFGAGIGISLSGCQNLDFYGTFLTVNVGKNLHTAGDSTRIRFHGGLIDESGPSNETLYLESLNTDIDFHYQFIGTTIWGGIGQTAVKVLGATRAEFVGCVIAPYLANTNTTGLNVAATGEARITATKLKGSGTGYAVNNSGTVIDGGGNDIPTRTGTGFYSAPTMGSQQFGFPKTTDKPDIAAYTAMPGANQAIFQRVMGSGTITKIAVEVGTASGNICVAVCRGPRGRNGPTSRIATSGAVACPAAGYREIALTGSVDVEEGDWFAISADNTTATFAAATTGGVALNELARGTSAYQSAAHPIPSTPATTAARMGTFVMVGVE